MQMVHKNTCTSKKHANEGEVICCWYQLDLEVSNGLGYLPRVDLARTEAHWIPKINLIPATNEFVFIGMLLCRSYFQGRSHATALECLQWLTFKEAAPNMFLVSSCLVIINYCNAYILYCRAGFKRVPTETNQ